MRLPRGLLVALVGAAALPVGAGSAAETWVEVKSPHFTLQSDASEKEARRAAWQLEQVRSVFARHWPWARLEPGRPLRILALEDARSMGRLFPPQFTGDAQSTYGLFLHAPDRYDLLVRCDTRKVLDRVSALYPNPYHAVYHEYVHLVLAANLPEAPAWLSEGLAEYWGATEVEGDDLLIGQPLWGHLLALRGGRGLPLSRLLAMDPNGIRHGKAAESEAFYAGSWALVHLLFNGLEGKGQGSMNRYASRLRAGVPEVEARKELPPEAELTRRLNEYVNRKRLNYLKGPAPEPPDSMKQYSVRRLSPLEVARLLADYLARHGPLAEARAAGAEVERLRDGPATAADEEAQGVLALRDNRRADSDAAFRRALELAPGEPGPAFHRARSAFERNPGPTEMERIEADLVRALERSPDFGPAWGALALVALKRGRPPAEAEAVARRGLQAEPGSTLIRTALAYSLAAQGREADARAEIAKARRAARSEAEDAAANAVLERPAPPPAKAPPPPQ